LFIIDDVTKYCAIYRCNGIFYGVILLQYFGHMIRAQNLFTYIFEGLLGGARGRGRPRRRWGDDIKDRTYKTLLITARDRKSWRELVRLRPSAMKIENNNDIIVEHFYAIMDC